MKRWMGSLGRATEIEADGQRPRVPIAVQIEANAGYATEYWPAREGPLRLRAVHPPAADSLPGDLGHVLDARTQDGDLLRAIVLGRASAHPGAVVPGHILGFVRPADAEEGWLLVVPEADRWLAMTGDVHDLPSDLQQRLLMFLQAERLEWIGAEEADIEARQAVLRGRRLLAQERAERAAAEAAWAPTEAARRRWATFEGEAHTAAELDILRLPYRFQLYAREVILPHERLLATVHRPGLSIGQWPFSRRTEHEALLLLTTRQLLLLSDARPPDTMVRFGGFAARATEVERLSGARMEAHDDYATLEVGVRSAASVSPWTLVAPQGRDATELAALIRLFAPRPNETLPAQRGHVEAQDANTTGWQAFFTEGAQDMWLARIQSALNPDEQVLTWALSPDMPGEARTAAAVAVTTRRVLVVSSVGPPESWPVELITTTEIRTSPFGSSLRVWTTRTAPELVLPFPFTLSPAFLDVFLALRQRLTAFSTSSAHIPEQTAV